MYILHVHIYSLECFGVFYMLFKEVHKIKIWLQGKPMFSRLAPNLCSFNRLLTSKEAMHCRGRI